MKSCCEDKGSEIAKLRHEQGKVLKIVLVINALMFFIEFSSGWMARSSALMADSLDMLGDALVYGFSLFVLHKGKSGRATAALLKGILILAFGIGVFAEVVLKIFSDIVPVAQTMGGIGFLALVANLTCLFLLMKHKNDDINMRSTYICSRNDIISNSGVIVAAILVQFMSSKWPDIVVGFIIAILFLKSAWQILVESIEELKMARKEAGPLS
jgi:cation diffusion facilitator family transporter